MVAASHRGSWPHTRSELSWSQFGAGSSSPLHLNVEADDSLDPEAPAEDVSCGRRHAEVAAIVTYLGAVLFKLAERTAAKQCHERAPHTFETGCGPSHPSAADALSGLGQVLRESGDFATVKECFEGALSVFEASYGSDGGRGAPLPPRGNEAFDRPAQVAIGYSSAAERSSLPAGTLGG